MLVVPARLVRRFTSIRAVIDHSAVEGPFVVLSVSRNALVFPPPDPIHIPSHGHGSTDTTDGKNRRNLAGTGEGSQGRVRTATANGSLPPKGRAMSTNYFA
ncbi:hypothetical protein Bbelb_013940 [Branchiostoma belcheri]|nr:hypothetical protein Bbelb_013940 [Branchiostoma belcheri]